MMTRFFFYQNKDHLLKCTGNIGRVHPIFCIPTGRHPDTVSVV